MELFCKRYHKNKESTQLSSLHGCHCKCNNVNVKQNIYSYICHDTLNVGMLRNLYPTF